MKNWKSKTAVFLFSQAISMFGSSVVGYAIIWYITLETSSASIMSLMIISSFLPQILLSPFAGVIADKYDRKKIIMLSDSFIAVATLALCLVFFAGYKSIGLICFVSVIRSIGSAFQAPAISSLLPQIVPPEELVRVNGMYGMTNSAITLISPAVGGALLGTVGFEYAMLTDVVTAMIAVGIMFFLKAPKQTRVRVSGSVWEELKIGINYVKTSALLKKLLLIYAVFYFLLAPAAFLTPLLVERSFGAEVWKLTANEMAWTIGALLGGVIVSAVGVGKDKIRAMMLTCCGCGVAFATMGLAKNFWVYLVIMAFAGLFTPFFMAADTTIIQQNVKEEMMGRVFSIVQIIVSSTMPLAMLLFGPLGDIMKIEYLMICSGIFIAALSPYILTCKKHIRRES